MLKRKLQWFLITVMFLSLLACGSTSKTKMVSGYEAMGKALAQIHTTGINLCETQKIIPADDCAKIKKVYNDTRKVYLVTGDTLILAMELSDTDWQKTADEQYMKLSAEFSSLLLQWLRLTTELGLIRKE